MTPEEKAAAAAQKIEDVITTQAPAMDESDWADAPELSEAQEAALAAAAKGAAASVEFDDTNHADDDGGGDHGQQTQTPTPAPARAVPRAPVTPPATDTTDDVPVGETVDPPVDQEPEFDLSLVEAAGLASAEEAKILFGTPKALENAVRLMDLRAISAAQEGVAAPVAPAAPARPAQQTTTPAESTVAAPAFEMPPPPDGEEWDDATVALVTGLQKQFADQLKAQQAVIEQQRLQTEGILAERRAIEQRRYVEEFDGFLQQLPDEWTPILGKESGFTLDPGSVQMKARQQLDTHAKLLSEGLVKLGKPALPMKDLLTRALRVAFPQIQERAVRKQVEEEVANREQLKTARPSGRQPAQHQTGLEAAAARAEQWYAKRGMAPLPFDDVDYDEV